VPANGAYKFLSSGTATNTITSIFEMSYKEYLKCQSTVKCIKIGQVGVQPSSFKMLSNDSLGCYYSSWIFKTRYCWSIFLERMI